MNAPRSHPPSCVARSNTSTARQTWTALFASVALSCATACGGTVNLAAHQRPLQQAQHCAPAEIKPSPRDVPETPQSSIAPPEVHRVLWAAQLSLPGETEPSRQEAVRVLIRLAAIQSEFLAGVAYVDCLDDSVETLERELVDRRSKNELYLTFGSIGLGAAAATTQGVLEVSDRDSNMAPVVGIAGGVSSAALGIAALLWPAPTVWLNHDINVLRSVWTGSDTGGLPLFVWRLLLIPRPNGESPREALKKRWKVMLNDRSADQGRQLEDLLFGAGGHYDLNALEFRETMLDQLETEIELMNRDLQNMTEFVALHYGIRT